MTSMEFPGGDILLEVGEIVIKKIGIERKFTMLGWTLRFAFWYSSFFVDQRAGFLWYIQ